MIGMYEVLRDKDARGEPVRVVVIGAGKFITMFLSQAQAMPGLHLVAVVDREPEKAAAALKLVGWPESSITYGDVDDAVRQGSTLITDDIRAVIECDAVDVVVEATGSPAAGLTHAMLALEHGKHLVNVNIEMDALVGPLVAQKYAAAGLVYSLASGDQPALICDLVDWARTVGFEVVAAGKGAKYHPSYHAITADTVWEHFPWFTPEQIASGEVNPYRFTSFVDGTKSSLEMATVSNATGLLPPIDGLIFPPAGEDEIAEVVKPAADGGMLAEAGMVESISDLNRDGSYVERNLHYGVWVVFRAPTDYATRCFPEYGIRTDSSGQYAQMFRPNHLIGLELGWSVVNAAVYGRPTGAPKEFRGDVVTVAKRALKAGETLDGEGGYCVRGKLVRAERSLSSGALPIGLSDRVTVSRDIAEGEIVGWNDVDVDETRSVVAVRREMEQTMGPRE